jgi:hypothetical protein
MQNIEHLSKIYHDSRPIRQSSKSNSPSASHVLAPHGIIQEELMTHRRIYSRSLLKPQHTTHFSFHTPQDFQTQLRVPVLERRFDNCARRTYPRPTLEPHHATIATCSFYTPQDSVSVLEGSCDDCTVYTDMASSSSVSSTIYNRVKSTFVCMIHIQFPQHTCFLCQSQL